MTHPLSGLRAAVMWTVSKRKILIAAFFAFAPVYGLASVLKSYMMGVL